MHNIDLHIGSKCVQETENDPSYVLIFFVNFKTINRLRKNQAVISAFCMISSHSFDCSGRKTLLVSSPFLYFLGKFYLPS